MTWNFDLSQAPRDGKNVILAMPNKTTLRSYWCTPKGEPEHWCMLSHKNKPVAFMPWPEHPFESQAKASVDNAAISAPEAAPAGREMQVGSVPSGSEPATSDGGRDGSERRAPISPDEANETMGGTGDDCCFGNRGVWPPQGGASSSRGNDSLSVVTAGETAPFIIQNHIFLDDAGSGQ